MMSEMPGGLLNRRDLLRVGSLSIAATALPASLAAQVSLTLETHERRRAEQVLKDYATALERANASLEASSHEVQAANQAKTEFLANMSHEIRTPLTSILGYAELVLHDEQIAGSADEREGALRVIQRNGEHLLGILNDILDLSTLHDT